MTYLCGHRGCAEDVTTRVRLRDDSGFLGHTDVCDEHAREIEAAAKKASPTAEITCGGYLWITEDGEEVNKGSIH